MRTRPCLRLLPWLLVAAAPAVVRADSPGWGSARGGPERDGHRPGDTELERPQVKWRERLGGALGAGALWVTAGALPEVVIATGGRVRAKRWDNAQRWDTPLYGFDQITAMLDTDGDGVDDLAFAASGGAAPVVAAIRRLGTEIWLAPDDELAPIASVRVVDLDGDGHLDVYVAFTRATAAGNVAVAFDLSAGLDAGRVMWRLPAADRDYVAGVSDVIAEVDGSPGLELVVFGHRRVYTYDAATGALESTSAELGPLPYGRATVRAVDVDADGTDELVAFSNQAWAASDNRRYVGVLGWDAASGALAHRWVRDVIDVVDDRVEFDDGSIADLDGDGEAEVAFGVYDAAADTWTLEVRALATGSLLASIAGVRFGGVAGRVVLAADEGEPLAAYRFAPGSGLTMLGAGAERVAMRCRVQSEIARESTRAPACPVPVLGQADRGLVAAQTEPVTGRIIALEVIDLGDPALSPLGRFTPPAGVYVTAIARMPDTSPAAVAVATTDGRVVPLDGVLGEVPPDVEIPYAWPGVEFGSAYSGVDLPTFPLAVPFAAHERVLAIGGGAHLRVLDASDDPSQTGGVDLSWAAPGNARGLTGDAVGAPVIVLDAEDGIEARSAATGDPVWAQPGWFSSRDALILHSDPLLVDSPAPRLWFHRRDGNRGSQDLTILDLADGEVVSSVVDLDINNGGWRRLSLLGDGSPASGRLDAAWRFDVETGAVLDSTPAPTGTVALGLDTVSPPSFLSVGLTSVSRHVAGVSPATWSVAHANAAGSLFRQGALLSTAAGDRFAIVEATSPTLVVLDVADGASLARVTLAGGAVVAAGAAVPSPVPALSNVTAVDALFDGGAPAWLVGGSDGFLYAVSAVDGALLWSLELGGPVGEVVPVDWDGDGVMELVASTADGQLHGIDRHTGEPPDQVLDTDPPTGRVDQDVDWLETEDTLHARWSAVDGATSYQVAVFTTFGDEVRGFEDVGAVTEVSLGGLSISPGQRYVVAVRAVTTAGVSTDRASNGVTVLAPPEEPVPTAPEGGCCAAGGRGNGDSAESTFLIGLVWLGLRARSGRRRAA